jgi:hypothetical protein
MISFSIEENLVVKDYTSVSVTATRRPSWGNHHGKLVPFGPTTYTSVDILNPISVSYGLVVGPSQWPPFSYT